MTRPLAVAVVVADVAVVAGAAFAQDIPVAALAWNFECATPATPYPPCAFDIQGCVYAIADKVVDHVAADVDHRQPGTRGIALYYPQLPIRLLVSRSVLLIASTECSRIAAWLIGLWRDARLNNIEQANICEAKMRATQ